MCVCVSLRIQIYESTQISLRDNIAAVPEESDAITIGTKNFISIHSSDIYRREAAYRVGVEKNNVYLCIN